MRKIMRQEKSKIGSGFSSSCLSARHSGERREKGFSLLETMISIGLILVGIISILNLFVKVAKDEITNRNKLTAIYLAEENIEMARELRDNNWLNGKSFDWQFGSGDQAIVLQNDNDPRLGFEVDTVNGGNAGRKQIFSANGGLFQSKNAPGGWVATNFKRWVTVTKANATTMQLVSHVSYNDVETATATAVLRDWR